MAVQTLIAALAAQCRDVRGNATHGDVFASFDREHRPQTIKTVERFEDGKTWPRNPQATVDAYANLAGLPPWDLWQMAIDRWREAQDEAQDDQSRRPPAHPPKAPPRVARSTRAKDQKQAGS